MCRLVRIFPLSAQSWSTNDLHTIAAHVCGENTHCFDVEPTPPKGCEHLKLQAVDAYHRDGFACSLNPEEFETRDTRPDVDQILGWTQDIRLGRSEAELEQVDGHECESHHARHDNTQFAWRKGIVP